MSEAAVSYVLGKLTDALDILQKKAQDLQGVSGQIEQMKLELGLVKGFLRDAGYKRKGNEFVKEWVNQVRDMAYRIEDVIDIFLVEIEENRPKSSAWLKKTYKKLSLGDELEEITQQLNLIYRRGTDMGIKHLGGGSEVNGQQHLRPTKPSDVDDSQVVGIEADKCEIIKQLLNRKISRRIVLSIVGTGGLGKTTLAQKVYKSPELGRHFDCRTWLSISQKFNVIDLLKEILYSIEPTTRQQNPPVTYEDLLVKLESSVRRKRYLLILDDVWKIDPWDQLKIALPDPNNGSRVIITTRSLDVAKAADCKTRPYELRCLNDDWSLALLSRNALQEHIKPDNYPPDLFEVAKRLTKKCGGLPLALVVLGSILARRGRTYNGWNTLEETMNWHLDDGEECMKILAMSYEALPYRLKPCFLYFASFPEDYKISGKHVTKMWIAEGFIPKDGAGTIEDRAEAYLEELVQRCLIQVTEKSWNGYCKYCSMHVILRDLAIHEAKEENFFTLFSKEEEDINHLTARKPRRAALQFCTLKKNGVDSEKTRALLCFGQYSSNHTLLNYSGFRLLRVLTIERADMSAFACRRWLKDLIHLKYLGFRYCTIGSQIFENNSFYTLETIDLKGTRIGSSGHPIEPKTIVIPTLRHIYGYSNLEKVCPLKWDHLTNLQTLKNVGHEEVPSLGGCVKNLRTLGICYWSDVRGKKRVFVPQEEMWQTLKDVLERMEQLVSLSIVPMVITDPLLLPFGTGGTKGLRCHEKIQRLHLFGKWETHMCVPRVDMFPTNLTKLTLVNSRLQEDPMPIFERLQSLRILRLRQFSYEGTKLICSTGGFPNLEKLELSYLRNLRHWDIKERAMPILSHLKINTCQELNVLPELHKLPTLQELLVNFPSHILQQRMQGEDLGSDVLEIIQFVWKILNPPKDLYKIKHIPSVQITRDEPNDSYLSHEPKELYMSDELSLSDELDN